MRILALESIFITLTICISYLNTNAQVGNTTIKQDSKFEQLLNEREK
jgi:hypothetical protein